MLQYNILVVEDDPKIAQLLKDYLTQEGFIVTILSRGGTRLPMRFAPTQQI